MEEQSSAARSRTVLNVTGPNRNLVEILDANADRMLSPRELATAIEQFSLWDTNGDGLLAKSEVPRQYRLTVGPASPDIPLLNQLQAATSIYGPQAKSSGPKIGPRWFQKMDRNGDGDVSRREFLFDAALFAKLDTNEDKRIDAKEAADLK